MRPRGVCSVCSALCETIEGHRQREEDDGRRPYVALIVVQHFRILRRDADGRAVAWGVECTGGLRLPVKLVWGRVRDARIDHHTDSTD